MNLTELAGHVAKLDIMELKALNTYVVGQINTKEGRAGASGSSGTFKTGDLAGFTYGGRELRVTVTGINRKSISCEEVSKPYAGKSGKWRVSPALLRLVGADKVALAPASTLFGPLSAPVHHGLAPVPAPVVHAGPVSELASTW